MDRQIFTERLIERASKLLPEVFTATRFFDLFPQLDADIIQLFQILAGTGTLEKLFAGCGKPVEMLVGVTSYEWLRRAKVDSVYRASRRIGLIREDHHRAALPIYLQVGFPWEMQVAWFSADEWYKERSLEKKKAVREALVGFVELGLEYAPKLQGVWSSLLLRKGVLELLPRDITNDLLRNLAGYSAIPDVQQIVDKKFATPDMAFYLPGEVSWWFLQQVFAERAREETPSHGVPLPGQEEQIIIEFEPEDEPEIELTDQLLQELSAAEAGQEIKRT